MFCWRKIPSATEMKVYAIASKILERIKFMLITVLVSRRIWKMKCVQSTICLYKRKQGFDHILLDHLIKILLA